METHTHNNNNDNDNNNNKPPSYKWADLGHFGVI